MTKDIETPADTATQQAKEPVKPPIQEQEEEQLTKPTTRPVIGRSKLILGGTICTVVGLVVALGIVLHSTCDKEQHSVLKSAQSFNESNYNICSVDNDCEVKNVGNCCGYYPECVNTAFIPDPENACSEGGVGDCGFPEIDHCFCQNGLCTGV